jgi:hypothetical protein
MPKPFELLLLVPIALLGSLGFGAVLATLISRMGGWHRLVEHYGTNEPPHGQRFWLQSAAFANASYSNCVTIYASEQGLYLSLMGPFRFAHPPLLIPWRDIHEVRRRRFLWKEWVVVEIGSPALAAVSLPTQVFEGRDLTASDRKGRLQRSHKA